MPEPRSDQDRPERRAREPEAAARAEPVESEIEVPAASTSASEVVERVQASLGNTFLNDALQGSSLDGLGTVLATDVGLALGGIESGEALGSNSAMLRAMRDARKDVAHPALAGIGSRAGGRPLPAEELARFSAAFGHDFSHVRLHVGDEAARAAHALNAHAFALGADVFFGAGEWEPGTADTDRLLAHELTHVQQHDEGRLGSAHGVSSPTDPHEREAYANEVRVVGALREVDAAIAEAYTVEPGVPKGATEQIPAPVAGRLSATLGYDGADLDARVSDGAEEGLAELAGSLGADAFVAPAALGAGAPALRRTEHGPHGLHPKHLADEAKAFEHRIGHVVWVKRAGGHRLPGIVIEPPGRREPTQRHPQGGGHGEVPHPPSGHADTHPNERVVPVRTTGKGGAHEEAKGKDIEPIADAAEILAKPRGIEALAQLAGVDPTVLDRLGGIRRGRELRAEALAQLTGLEPEAARDLSAVRDLPVEARAKKLAELVERHGAEIRHLEGVEDFSRATRVEALTRMTGMERSAVEALVHAESSRRSAEALAKAVGVDAKDLALLSGPEVREHAGEHGRTEGGKGGAEARHRERGPKLEARHIEVEARHIEFDARLAKIEVRHAMDKPKGAKDPAKGARDAKDEAKTAKDEAKTAKDNAKAAKNKAKNAKDKAKNAKDKSKDPKAKDAKDKAKDAQEKAKDAKDKAKDAKDKAKHAKGKDGKTGKDAKQGKGGAATPAADKKKGGGPNAGKIAALKDQIAEIQFDLDMVQNEIDFTDDRLDEIKARLDKLHGRNQELDGKIAAMRKRLKGIAAKRQKQKRPAESPDDDPSMRSAQAEKGRIPEKIQEEQDDQDFENRQKSEWVQRQQDDQQKLQEKQQELQKLQQAGRGGAPGRKQIDWKKTSAAVIAALRAKLVAENHGYKKEVDAQKKLEKQIKAFDKSIDELKKKALKNLDQQGKENKSILTATTRVDNARYAVAQAKKNQKDGEPDKVAAAQAKLNRARGTLNNHRAKLATLKTEQTALVQQIKDIETKKAPVAKDLQDRKDKDRDGETDTKLHGMKAIIDSLPTAGEHLSILMGGAAKYGCKVKPIYLPPGEMPDDPNTDVSAALKQQQKAQDDAAAAAAKKQQKATEDAKSVAHDKGVSLEGARKLIAEGKANPKQHAPPSKDPAEKDKNAHDHKPKTPQEIKDEKKQKEDKKKAEEEQKIIRISQLMDEAPDKRANDFAKYGRSLKPPMGEAELRALYVRTVKSVHPTDRLKKIHLPVPKGEMLKTATDNGISVAQLDAYQTNEHRKQVQARAEALLGVKDGQKAVDQLWKMGASRKMNPEQLMTHLGHVDPKSVKNMALKALCARAKAAENERIDKLPADKRVAERKKLDDAAKATEEHHNAIKAVCENLNCKPDQAEGYVKVMAAKMGGDEKAALKILQDKNKAANAKFKSVGQLERALDEARKLTPAATREAKMKELMGQAAPEAIVGVAMTPTKSDDSKLTKGPVASDAFEARMDQIKTLPPEQQFEEYQKLSKLTGKPMRELMQADTNYHRRKQTLDSASQIDAGEQTTEQKEAAWKALADKTGKTVEELKAALQRSEQADRVALGLVPDPKHPKEKVPPSKAKSTWDDVIKAGTDGHPKLSKADRETKLKEIAAETGRSVDDLERLYAHEAWEAKKKKLYDQFGGDEAHPQKLDAVIAQAEARGMTLDKFVDHLKNLPASVADKDPKLKAMKASLSKWQSRPKNADPSVKAQNATKKALDKVPSTLNELAALQKSDPAKYAQEKKKFDQVRAAGDAMLHEINDSYVYVSDSVIMKQMNKFKGHPEMLAALIGYLRTKGGMKNVMKGVTDGLSGDAKTAATKMLKAGNSYNDAIRSAGGAKAVQKGEDKVAEAVREEEQFQTSKAIAAKMNIPRAEAAAHIAAIQATTGCSAQEAADFMQGKLRDKDGKVPSPGKNTLTPADLQAKMDKIRKLPPKERLKAMAGLQGSTPINPETVLAALYHVPKGKKGAPNPSANFALKTRLTAVNAMPPGPAKDAAFDRLCHYTGKSYKEMRKIHFQVLREDRIVAKMHEMRDLPKKRRAAQMKSLQKQYRYSPQQMKDLYDQDMKQVGDRLPPDKKRALDTFATQAVDPKDMKAHAKEMAEKTGLPEADILRYLEHQVTENFKAKMAGHAGLDVDKIREKAYDTGMSPEAFVNKVVRSAPSALKSPDLVKLHQDLKTANVQPKYSEAEQEARAKLANIESNPKFLDKTAKLRADLKSGVDKDIVGDFRGMTPLERRQFIDDYNRDRTLDKHMPKFVDLYKGALQGDSQSDFEVLYNNAMSKSTDDWATASLQVVDTGSKTWKDNYAKLRDDIKNSKKSDEDAQKRIKADLEKLKTPAERAEFINEFKREMEEEQNKAAHGNRDPKHTGISPLQYLDPDSAAYKMLFSVQSLAQARANAHIEEDATKIGETLSTKLNVAREASKALGISDPRAALSMVQRMSDSSGMSLENTWRVLNHEKPIDENKKEIKYPGEAKLTARKKEAMADRVLGELTAQSKKGYFTRKDSKIIKALQGAPPEVLAMVNARIIKQGGKYANLEAMLKDMVDGDEVAQYKTELRKMRNWENNQHEVPGKTLVNDLAEMPDETELLDPSSDQAIAKRMMELKALPPEKRFAAMQEMADQFAGKSPKELMRAFMNGPAGVEGDDGMPTLLTPAMQQRMADIHKLPPDQRKKALQELADLTGRDRGQLEEASKQSAKSIQAATQLDQIQKLPPEQREEKLAALMKQTGMSEERLYEVHDQALKQGVLPPPHKTITPDVAKRLQKIQNMKKSGDRKKALDQLMADADLSKSDLLAYANSEVKAQETEKAEKQQVANDASNLKDLVTDGRKDDIKKLILKYKNDPAKLKKLMAAYGEVTTKGKAKDATSAGINALENMIDDQFGAKDKDGTVLTNLLRQAYVIPQEPPLPAGVGKEQSQHLAGLEHRLSLEKDPQKRSDLESEIQSYKDGLGLNAGDLDKLEQHAKWDTTVLEQKAFSAMKLMNTELNSTYVDDDNMKKILAGVPDDVLPYLDEQFAKNGKPNWQKQLSSGVDGKIYNDFANRMKISTLVEGMDANKAKEKRTKERVDYKYKQLVDKKGNVLDDPGQLTTLLADASPEEIARLDAKLKANNKGGLKEIVSNALKASDHDWLKTAAVVMVAVSGVGIGVAAALMASLNARSPKDLSTLARVKHATQDPWTKADPKNVNDQYKVLETELDAKYWTSEKNVAYALQALSPTEMIAVEKRWKKEHGESLDAKLHKELGGDELAEAVASEKNATDQLTGKTDPGAMKDACLEMAENERLDELKRDPKYKGRSEDDLWKIVEQEEPELKKKAVEKEKKIQEKANAIFKAIDGIGDDTKTAMDAVASCSPEELKWVRIEYRDHYGKDMMTHLQQDLGWYDSKEFKIISNLQSNKPAVREQAMKDYIGYYSYDWGPEDEEKIYGAFQNMSVEERTKLARDKDFMARVKEDLDSSESSMVDAVTEIDPKTGMSEPNPAHVAAVRMKLATEGSGAWWDFSSWGTDEEGFLDQLDGLTPAQVKEAERYYNEHLQSDSGTFREMVDGEFDTNGREIKVIDAELRGDKVAADVQRIRYAAQDENPTVKVGVVAATTLFLGPLAGVVAGVIMASNNPLEQEVMNVVGGTDKDLLEKTLKGDAKGLKGVDKKKHLAEVRAAFNKTFGGKDGRYEVDPDIGGDALQNMIDEEFSGMEQEYFTEVAKKGKASPEMTLIYSMKGAGSKTDKTKEVMAEVAKMSPAERTAFKKRFADLSKDLFPGDDISVEEWLASDYSGEDLFNFQMDLMGPPKTPADYVQRAQMRYDFQRGSPWNAIGTTFMDVWSSVGGTSTPQQLERSTGDVMAMVGPDGKLRAGYTQEDLERKSDWQKMDTENYGAVKDTVADAVSNAAQVVAGIALLFVPVAGEAADAALLANFLRTAAEFGAQMVPVIMKAAIKGESGSQEEFATGALTAALSAATAGLGDKVGGLGKLFGGKLAGALSDSKMLAELLENVGQNMLKSGFDSFVGSLTANGDAWDHGGMSEYMLNVLKATGKGAATGALTSAFGFGLEKGTKFGRRLSYLDSLADPRGHLGEHMALRYASNVVNGAFASVIDPDQWKEWSKGEGFGKGLVKSLLVDTALDALKDVAPRHSATLIKRKRKTAEERLKNAEDDLAAAKKRLAGMDPKSEEYKKAAKQIAENEKEVASRKKELDDLVANLSQKAKSYQDWEVDDHVRKLHEDIEAKESVASDLEEKVKALKAKGKKSKLSPEDEAELTRLEGELTEAKGNVSKLKKQEDEARRKFIKARAEREGDDETLKKLKAEEAKRIADDAKKARRQEKTHGNVSKGADDKMGELADAADEAAEAIRKAPAGGEDPDGKKPPTEVEDPNHKPPDGGPPPGNTPPPEEKPPSDEQSPDGKPPAGEQPPDKKPPSQEQPPGSESSADTGTSQGASTEVADSRSADETSRSGKSAPDATEPSISDALPTGASRAVQSGDPTQAEKIFEEPQNQAVARDAIVHAGSEEAAKQHVEELLDMYGGDSAALKKQFAGDENKPLRDAVDAVAAKRKGTSDAETQKSKQATEPGSDEAGTEESSPGQSKDATPPSEESSETSASSEETAGNQPSSGESEEAKPSSGQSQAAERSSQGSEEPQETGPSSGTGHPATPISEASQETKPTSEPSRSQAGREPTDGSQPTRGEGADRMAHGKEPTDGSEPTRGEGADRMAHGREPTGSTESKQGPGNAGHAAHGKVAASQTAARGEGGTDRMAHGRGPAGGEEPPETTRARQLKAPPSDDELTAQLIEAQRSGRMSEEDASFVLDGADPAEREQRMRARQDGNARVGPKQEEEALKARAATQPPPEGDIASRPPPGQGGVAAPGSGPEFVGTSADIGESYTAMGRGRAEPGEVRAAAEEALGGVLEVPPGLDVRLAHDPRREKEPVPEGRTPVSIEVGTPKGYRAEDGSWHTPVARYEADGKGGYKIVVSAGAKDHQVGRAIAQELTEIHALHGRAGNQGISDALRPSASANELSPHDRGRVAELDVLAKQLQAPPKGVTKAQLHTEFDDLVKHLGLEGVRGAPARMALVKAQLGPDHTVVKMLEAHHEEHVRTTREALFDELRSPHHVSDKAVLAHLRNLSPEDRLEVQEAWNDRHKHMGDVYQRPFREMLLQGMSGGDKYAAVELLEEARTPHGSKPLVDPVREADVSARVTAFHQSLNRQADKGTPQDVIKAVSGLRSEEEKDRFFALAEERYGPRYSRQHVDMMLADRLGDADFTVATAYVRHGPVVGAAMHLAKIAGESVVGRMGEKERHRLSGESDVRVIGGILDHKGRLGRYARDRLGLDDADKAIAVLDGMTPEDRRQLVGSPMFKALQGQLDEVIPKKGALRHKWEAMQEPDEEERHAGLLAAQLHQAFEGSGKKLDRKHMIATDREGIAEVLETLQGHPKLFEKTLLAYRRQAAADRGKKLDDPDDVVEALRQVRGDITKHSHKLGERDVLDLIGIGKNAQHHERQALLAGLDRNVLDWVSRGTVAKLEALRPGRPYSAEELKQVFEASGRSDATGRGVKHMLDQAGIDREALGEYADALESQEQTEKAHKAAAAIKKGDLRGAVGVVADPTLRARRQELLATLGDESAHPGDREYARRELAKLDRERASLMVRIVQVSGGSITPEDLGYNEGGRERSSAKDKQLGIDKRKWLARAFVEGDLADHEKLYLAIRGAGTDVPAIRTVFTGKSPQQAQKIMDDFKETFGHQAFLGLSGILGHPLQALRGGGQEWVDSAIFTENAIDSERLDKRTKAELHMLTRGDPKLVFDPANPPADPSQARAAAKTRLQAELDALDTMQGVERDHGLRQRYSDWEERQQAKLGWAEQTGVQLDQAHARVHEFASQNWHSLVEQPDPATWAEYSRLKQHAEALRGEHVQFRADLAESATRGVGRVGGLATAGLGHLDAQSAAKVVKVVTALTKIGVQSNLAGTTGANAEKIAGLGLGLGVGAMDSSLVAAAIRHQFADLTPEQHAEVIKILKENGLTPLADKVVSTVGTKAISGEFHRSAEARTAEAIADAVLEGGVDVGEEKLVDKAKEAVAGNEEKEGAEKGRKEGDKKPEEKDSKEAHPGGAAGELVADQAKEEGVVDVLEKAPIEGVMAEMKRTQPKSAGAERVKEEQTEHVKEEQAEVMKRFKEALGTRGAHFDPNDAETAKFLVRDMYMTPEQMERMGVRPDVALAALTAVGKEEAESGERAQLREETPDRAERLLDEAKGYAQSMMLVGTLQARVRAGGSVDQELPTDLLAHSGIELPSSGDPDYGRRVRAIKAMSAAVSDHLVTDDSAKEGQRDEEVVDALTAFRQYERNEVRLRVAQNTRYRVEIEEENEELAEKLRDFGVDVDRGAVVRRSWEGA